MIVVTDAGPLIYLGGAGHLDLLRLLFEHVVVPSVVYDEVTVAGAGRVGSDAVAAARWLSIEPQSPDPALLADLDAGEAAAIPLAERLHARLLVDDARARAIAEARGLQVVGTLGVLLLAKHNGHLDAVGPVIDHMTGLGMHVSDALRTTILRIAGE